MTDKKPAKSDSQWPLWEVFTQSKTGLPHEHAGSLHAPDAEMALQNARQDEPRDSNGCLDGKADTQRQYGAETTELVDRDSIMRVYEYRQAGL